MRKKKWTPGPWNWAKMEGPMIAQVFRTNDADGELICSINHRDGKDTANANAYLIAASPELAEIAIEHETRLRHCAQNIIDEFPLWAADLIKMADQARAVLAKARGETE